MPLTRIASGLLARHEAGSSTHPFSAADWQVGSGVSVSLDIEGRLTIAIPGSGGWHPARYTPIASRSKTLVQVAGRLVSPTGTQHAWVTAGAHIGSGSGTHLKGGLSIQRPTGERSWIVQHVNGIQTTYAGADVPGRTAGVDYRVSLYTDGSAATMYDHDNGVLLGPSTVGLSSGAVGFVAGAAATYALSAWYAMADRYVRVTGLPPGFRVRVGPASAAADEDGVAVVDLISVQFPQEHIEVLNGDGGVVEAIAQDEGVWGGDEYAWIAPFALARVQTGLIARHRANDPHRPFAATDWAAPSGVTLGVSSGALTITGNPIGWRAVRRAAAQARSRGLVQVVGRANLGQATWFGPAAHIDSLTDPDVVGTVGSIGRTPTENTRLLEFENGSQTDLASSAVPARSTNTSYRFSIFVDGSSAVGHDHDNEITLSGTAPNREGGYFGILLGRTAAQAPTYTILEYYECADRYLRVTGLPPGYQVRVGDAVGVADASGEAVVDMLAVPFPQEVLEILDADGNTVTALETPIGLWGGDEFRWLDAPRLTRATAGLLARHEAGSATYPFSAADWDVPSGVTVSVDAQGRLALSRPAVAAWRHIHHRHVPSHTRVFTQSLAARTSGMWGGDAAHADAGGTNHVRIQWSYGRPQGEATNLAQNTGNTETPIGQLALVPARASEVDYRFSLWVDGAEVVGYDHGNGVMLSGTSTTHTSGGVGCALGGGATGRRYSAYYVMADRYLRVTGLPAGYSVRIGELVETAAGGAAVFDLLAVALPLASDTIEVLDGSGNVVAALTPDGGVWGGDEYEFSGEPEPENPWEPCPPPPNTEWEACPSPDVLRREVDVDARLNGAANPAVGLAVGITIDGFQPDETLVVRPNFDGPYIAFSPWGKPERTGPDTGSQYRINVVKDGDPSRMEQYEAEGGPFDGYEAARRAFVDQFPNGVSLTGAASYTFYIQDTPVGDNTGGVSLVVERQTWEPGPPAPATPWEAL